MTISVERDFELVTLEITGRLDTTTAPKLEAVIGELSEDIKELVFNVSELEYISSAGIRVMLKAYKKMTANRGIIQITNGIFHRTRTKNFTIHMGIQKTPNSKSSLEK